MRKIVCVVLLICVCFSLVACAIQEEKEAEYGYLQCKEIAWHRNRSNGSVEAAIRDWSASVPDAKIEDILIHSRNQYNEYGVIFIFYRLPIE